jgi:hypothetical protein
VRAYFDFARGHGRFYRLQLGAWFASQTAKRFQAPGDRSS